MDWTNVQTEQDINDLLNAFGGFHDGVLREIHLWNSYSVNEKLTMSAGNQILQAKILFQRQWQNPSAIEVFFEDIQSMSIKAIPKGDWYMIFDCVLIQKDGLFYWADNDCWTIDAPDKAETTWISARSIKWRDRSDWMGDVLRYGTEN